MKLPITGWKNTLRILGYKGYKTGRQHKRPQKNSPLQYGNLEPRQLLASVTLSGDVLTVRGDAGDDVIELYGNGAQTAFTVGVNDDAALTQTFNNADVSKVLVYAGGGNDEIKNTLRIPTDIYGQNGDDLIYGGYAADQLYGGSGNDTIRGRSGDDTLFGGDGEDFLDGGDGNDLLYGQNDNDTLNGLAGNDDLRGGLGNDTLRGGDGDDNLLGQGGDDTMFGGDGDDLLSGGDGDDLLFGQNDDDELNGNGGDDDLRGGDGDDVLSGADGADRLLGQGGNDQLSGGNGDDYLHGGDQNDSLYGQAGADQLYGHAGIDLLDAGVDQDVDLLNGGTGYDRFEIVGEIGAGSVDVVQGRSGTETYAGFSGVLTTSVEEENGVVTIRGLDQDDRFQIDSFNSGSQFHVLVNYQLVSTFNTADISEIVMYGGAGNDRVLNNGLSVPTRIYGQSGDDQLDGGSGTDIISGGNGNDTLHGNDGDDRLSGNAGDDSIGGGNGDDIINGGTGNDLLGGQAGDDFVGGNEGNDRIYGDAGNDTLSGGDGNDDLYGGGDNDLIDGDAGDDRLWGGLQPDTLRGGAGNDQLRGEHGDDVLQAGLGDDYLHGGTGNDELFGEQGSDELWGGAHDDKLNGGLDNTLDTLWGNGGLDVFCVEPLDVVRDRSGSETMDDGTDPTANLGAIGDLVFIDQNENGIFEAGDQGLAGATVTLLQGSTEIATQITGSDGSYVFGNLAAGTYTVQLPASSLGNRTATTATSFSVTLVQDQQNGDVDFGVTPTPTDPQNNASIGDLVFEDLDGDGVLDSDESGLADVMLRLLQNGTELETITTDSGGNYFFDNLAAGNYQVELIADSLGEREATTASSIAVTLIEGQTNADADFGVTREVTDAFETLASVFATTLSEQGFLEVASIVSTEVVETTNTFSIVDLGESKLAFTRIESDPTQYNLYGEFPASLTAEQIENNFGSGSDFSNQVFFPTGVTSITTVSQEFLGAGFAAGSKIIVATSGETVLAVASVLPSASGSPAAVSVFDSANAVQVVREAQLQGGVTGEQLNSAFENAGDGLGNQAALKAAIDARLTAVEARHSTLSYWPAIGGPAYILKLRAALQTVGKIEIGDPGANTTAKFVVTKNFFGIPLSTKIVLRPPLTGVSDNVLVHEIAHALNNREGNDGDSAADERVGYAVGELIGGGLLAQFFSNFEMNVAGINPLTGGQAIQTQWNRLWFRDNGINQDSGLSPSLLNVRYSDRNSAPVIDDEQIDTTAFWVEIENITGLSISCEELAAVYSARHGVDLTCPNEIDAAFQ